MLCAMGLWSPVPDQIKAQEKILFAILRSSGVGTKKPEGLVVQIGVFRQGKQSIQGDNMSIFKRGRI